MTGMREYKERRAMLKQGRTGVFSPSRLPLTSLFLILSLCLPLLSIYLVASFSYC